MCFKFSVLGTFRGGTSEKIMINFKLHFSIDDLKVKHMKIICCNFGVCLVSNSYLWLY